MKNEVTQIALKTSPPALVTMWHYVLGLPVEKWVAVATLIYVVVQTVVLVRDKFFRK